jgi:hypothetical protein
MELVTLALLTLFTLRPLLEPGLAETHEMDHYPIRAQQMHTAHVEGQLWPRWAPDLAKGYGYPIFNYYAPLSIWLIEGCHVIAGLDWHEATDAACAVLTVIAVLSMWGLGRSVWRWPGGLVAAVAYLSMPHRLTNAYVRGDLAELAAMAFLPLALWALIATLRWGHVAHAAALALAWALVIFSHNITALLSIPLLVAVAVIFGIAKRPPAHHLMLTVAGGALGLGISAIFWMPALLERGLTSVHRVAEPESYFDYHHHFVHPRQLFLPESFPDGISEEGTDDTMSFEIGNAALVLALVTFCASWRRGASRRLRFVATGLIALLLAGSVMMTPATGWLWERLPLIAYAQFPWRLMAVLGVIVALLAGGSVHLLPRDQWWIPPVIAVATLLPVYASLHRLKVLPPLMGASVLYTRENFSRVFTTSTVLDEYLPVTTKREIFRRPLSPGPGEVLCRSPDVRIRQVRRRAGEIRFTAEAPHPTSAVLGVLHFPGWRVEVKGHEHPAGHLASSGLISVPLPAGERVEVAVRLRLTPIQRWATAITILSLAATLALLAADLLSCRGRRAHVPPSPQS